VPSRVATAAENSTAKATLPPLCAGPRDLPRIFSENLTEIVAAAKYFSEPECVVKKEMRPIAMSG
jgi:hypothetical protein